MTGAIVITGATLKAAEKELITEYTLAGKTLPEHVVKNDSMDQPCTYCTLVSRRAIAMVVEAKSAPVN